MKPFITSKKSFTVLILLLFINTLPFSSAKPNPPSPSSCTEFIKTSCNFTSYPHLCVITLSQHATLIQTSPKKLAHAALNVTLATAKSTSVLLTRLSHRHGLKPREIAAMTDCLEEISDSVDELRRSVYEMGKIQNSNFRMTMSDIQTWVSAALTDEYTCSDGFAGKKMNGVVKDSVRRLILNVVHVTSNSLALINRFNDLNQG